MIGIVMRYVSERRNIIVPP